MFEGPMSSTERFFTGLFNESEGVCAFMFKTESISAIAINVIFFISFNVDIYYIIGIRNLFLASKLSVAKIR